MRVPIRLLLLVALAFSPLRSAAAHPKLLKGLPVAGSRGAAPREIRLTFNEAITPALSRIALFDVKKQTVTLGTLVVASDDPRALVVSITAPMAPGRYTVRWQAAAADGHPVRGSFTFEVAAAASP